MGRWLAVVICRLFSYRTFGFFPNVRRLARIMSSCRPVVPIFYYYLGRGDRELFVGLRCAFQGAVELGLGSALADLIPDIR